MRWLEKLGLYKIPQKISDLSSENIINQNNIFELRKKINILVVDDKEFDFLNPLRSCGFNIRYLEDLSDVRDASAYEIILCDIMGVGTTIDEELQGASIIKQIKIVYPLKRVIAYTASNYDPTFNEALGHADSVMLKGSSFDDWSNLLDTQIMKLMNPCTQWEILRYSLLEAGVSTIDAAKIEDRYVKAFQTKNAQPIKELVSADSSSNVGTILSGFLSSTLAKVVLGALT